MSKGGPRPGSGRPRLDPRWESVPVSIIFHGDLLVAVDRYAADHGLNRSAAVRRACAYFLAHQGETEPAAASE